MAKDNRRERLIYCRKAAGITQQQAADALGWTRESIAKLEGGNGGLTETKRNQLAKLYGFASWQLLESAPLLTQQELKVVRLLQSLDQKKVEAVELLLEQLAGPPSQKE